MMLEALKMFSPSKMLQFSILQEINYDSARGGVSVITEKGEITTSYLLIQRAKSSDSGQYTCSPSNANSKSVNVHILAGKCILHVCPRLIENKNSVVDNVWRSIWPLTDGFLLTREKQNWEWKRIKKYPIFAGEHPEAMHSNKSPSMTLNIGFMWSLATANVIVIYIANHINRIS